MANKIKRLKTKIVRTNEEIYNTLVGSIVTTVGILCGYTEKENNAHYKELKKMKNKMPHTVDGICKLIWSMYGKDEVIPLRSNVVLVYDKINVRTPLVTLVNEEGNILPLKRNGDYTGILMTACAGSEYVGVEFLYDENGFEIIDEEENCNE